MVTPCILSQEAAGKDTLPEVRKITEKKDDMRFRKEASSQKSGRHPRMT